MGTSRPIAITPANFARNAPALCTLPPSPSAVRSRRGRARCSAAGPPGSRRRPPVALSRCAPLRSGPVAVGRDAWPPPPVGAPHPPGSRRRAITRGGSPPRCAAWHPAPSPHPVAAPRGRAQPIAHYTRSLPVRRDEDIAPYRHYAREFRTQCPRPLHHPAFARTPWSGPVAVGRDAIARAQLTASRRRAMARCRCAACQVAHAESFAGGRLRAPPLAAQGAASVLPTRRARRQSSPRAGRGVSPRTGRSMPPRRDSRAGRASQQKKNVTAACTAVTLQSKHDCSSMNLSTSGTE